MTSAWRRDQGKSSHMLWRQSISVSWQQRGCQWPASAGRQRSACQWTGCTAEAGWSRVAPCQPTPPCTSTSRLPHLWPNHPTLLLPDLAIKSINQYFIYFRLLMIIIILIIDNSEIVFFYWSKVKLIVNTVLVLCLLTQESGRWPEWVVDAVVSLDGVYRLCSHLHLKHCNMYHVK